MKRIAALVLALLMWLNCACAQEVWTPREAPPVRQSLAEEEKQALWQAILAKGEHLFTGVMNQRYRAFNIRFLKEADPADVLAMVYNCAGGGCLLTLESGGQSQDIVNETGASDKEKLYVLTVQELMDMAGAATPADLRGLSINVGNGGALAGLYFLKGETAQEMADYQARMDDMEQIIHTYTGGLSNPNATENAKAVYAYLQEINGKLCLTGQMESTWMGSPDYEMSYIQQHTGELPALRGLDFMHNDFKGVVRRAKAWWEKGGIPSICWHTGSDFASGYNESLNHDLNWAEALTPGTKDYEKLLKAMDRAVPYLQQLEDDGVPVLWRPFHELDGGWFWWSKGGSENFVKLWQLMYSRYTDHWGLDNLIWVLGYSGNGGNMAAWYPGDSYVDVVGADSYTAGANGQLYAECVSVAAQGMPIIFHECGSIPTQEQMDQAAAPWALFMVWHTDHITNHDFNTPESLKQIYSGERFITLDELPALAR